VDWLGGFLFIGSATSFLIAASWGGNQYAWNSAPTIVPLVLGVAGLAGTFVWESRFGKQPLLRKSLFWNVSSIATYVGAAVQGFLLYGQLYYIPFYFLTVKRFTPTQTGAALLPVMLTLVPGGIVTGALVTRSSNYRPPIWIGWVLTTVGTGLSILWTTNQATALWVVTLIILGFGHGAILNAQNFATQAMCKPGEEGAAAAMYAFLRQFGMALGVGVGGTCFQNVMALKLQSEGVDTDIARNSEAFVEQLGLLPDSDFKTNVLNGYAFGLMGVYAVYVGMSGLAFLVSLLIKHCDMNKKLDTEHTLEKNRVLRIAEARRARNALAWDTISDSEIELKVAGPEPRAVQDVWR